MKTNMSEWKKVGEELDKASTKYKNALAQGDYKTANKIISKVIKWSERTEKFMKKNRRRLKGLILMNLKESQRR